MTTHPNIRFAYLYRDASNYKQHGEVIFCNENQLTAEEIEKQIRSFLSDELFFIARQIHVEECFFDVVNDNDHPYIGWDEKNIREDVIQQIGKEGRDLKRWLTSEGPGQHNPGLRTICRCTHPAQLDFKINDP